MKNQNFYYAIFAFLVIVFCALTAIRVFADAIPGMEPPEKKKHSSVKITKSMIEKYNTGGGVEMRLTFKEAKGGHIKLTLTGINKHGKVIMEEELQTVKNNVLFSRNLEYGTITKDDTGRTLHQMFAAGEPREWVLRPVPYDSTGNYVSYEIDSSGNPELAAAAGRLNPSPPAR